MATSRNAIMTAVACCASTAGIIALIGPEKILEARLLNDSFMRQMSAAFHLANSQGYLQPFSQWNTSDSLAQFKEGPVHLTYTTFAYLGNVIIALIAGSEQTYNKMTLILSTAVSGISGCIILLSIKQRRVATGNHPWTTLGLCTAALYLTNPANLAAYIEPDFEDLFLLLSLFGLYFLEKRFCWLSNATFAIASFMYPLGGGVICAASFIYMAARKKMKRDLLKLKAWRKVSLPLNKNIPAGPFIIGVITWYATRISYVLTSPVDAVYSGGSLFKRAGIDISDTFYGGIAGIVRFLAPISGIPRSLLEAVGSSSKTLAEFWEILNYAQIAATLTVLSALALFYGLLSIADKSRSDETINCSPARYFLLLTVGIAVLLPQWSSVHFRLLARFFAPAMSFYLAHFLVRAAWKLSKEKGTRQLTAFAITSLICIEQLHFFGKWILGAQ